MYDLTPWRKILGNGHNILFNIVCVVDLTAPRPLVFTVQYGIYLAPLENSIKVGPAVVTPKPENSADVHTD